MQVGTDRVLVCARVDFIDDYSAADLEEACLRIDADLRDRFTDLDEIFIQPVPRSDPDSAPAGVGSLRPGTGRAGVACALRLASSAVKTH